MKRMFIYIVLLCTIGCSFVSCTRKRGPLQDGRSLEERGNYIGALNHYRRMSDPGFGDVCEHNLRHLYGDILDAIQAQKKSPDSAEAFYQLGKAYYEKALSIPDEHEVVPNQGFDTKTYFAEQQKQFHSQADTTLESATQLQPNYQEALLLKGILYEETEQPEKAIPVYQQLVDLEPESPEAFYRLGMLLHEQGQTEEGLELVKQAVDMEPENDTQAIAEFHQTLCSNPQYVDAYYRLAQLYLRQSNLVDAERVLLLGLKNNSEALRLSILYRSLKSILDDKAFDEFVSIYKQVFGEVIGDLAIGALADREFEPSPELEIRYFQLYISILERRRPYILPCAGIKEHPFFNRQITLLQGKIEELEQSIQSEEETAPTEE
jgi:tetratricopeptide (TPR) repeat protein